jgi:Caspase domain
MTRLLWTVFAVFALAATMPVVRAQFFGGGGVPDSVMETLSGPEHSSDADSRKPKPVVTLTPTPAPKPAPGSASKPATLPAEAAAKDVPAPEPAARPKPVITWNPALAPKPAPAVASKPSPTPTDTAVKETPPPAPKPVVAPLPGPSAPVAAIRPAAPPPTASIQPVAPRPASSFDMPAIDGHRLALVIGNSKYKSGRLDNPYNDARLISGTLRQVGFEVIEVLDASQREMKRAIQRFGAQLDKYGKNAVALFYYAGHGIQAGGRNYLIPVDAMIRRETDLDIEAVPADWVIQQLEFAKSALNLIVLDACRNNPFSSGFRSVQNGLARMDAPTGTLIAYSTAPGDVAADGDGKNSPYSHALARAILVPGTPVEQAFKEVRVSVRRATKGAQTPWESSSLTGDFFFVPPTQQGRR